MDRAQTVVTIGSFDGVHRGHAALLRRAGELAGAGPSGTRVVALAFDPHPATLLRPDRVPGRLTTFADRARLLKDAGADEVVKLEPTPALLSLSPAAFVEWLIARYRPLAVVEGPDFRFGHKRAGDMEALGTLGRIHGFAAEAVPSVEVVLNDMTIVPASSTMMRWLLEHGRVEDAALVAGRPYTVPGTVVRGDRRGRTIGFPTANIQSPCTPPADGVYAGFATLNDGRSFPAAISVGTKPTFGPHERSVEAYLLNTARAAGGEAIEGLPEYGWPLELSFTHWLRDQVRFESVPALLDQMGRDCSRVQELAGSSPERRQTA